MRKFIIIGVCFLAFFIGAFSYIFCEYLLPGYGAVFEEREISNETYKVRVQRRPALYGLMQYYYVLEYLPAESYFWREVLAHPRDEPKSINAEQLHFVNEEVSYFFIDKLFVISVDSGKNWNIWKQNYFIEKVDIHTNGKGTIRLWEYDTQMTKNYRIAYTSDFGQNWSFEDQNN